MKRVWGVSTVLGEKMNQETWEAAERVSTDLWNQLRKEVNDNFFEFMDGICSLNPAERREALGVDLAEMAERALESSRLMVYIDTQTCERTETG
jgi:hypothetical protein